MYFLNVKVMNHCFSVDVMQQCSIHTKQNFLNKAVEKNKFSWYILIQLASLTFVLLSKMCFLLLALADTKAI